MHLRVVLSVEALYGEENALYWKSFESQNSKRLTLLKRQNTKTDLYNLPKNYWVIALIEIYWSARRKKKLVRVVLDHPVPILRVLPVLYRYYNDYQFRNTSNCTM